MPNAMHLEKPEGVRGRQGMKQGWQHGCESAGYRRRGEALERKKHGRDHHALQRRLDSKVDGLQSRSCSIKSDYALQ